MTYDQTPRRGDPEYRKQSQGGTYSHSPFNPSQAPWTATRCLRLLRPISSKINTLEKLRRSGEYRDDDTLVSDSDNDHQIAYQSSQVRREHLPDNSWDSNPRPRKKIKRTYSARQKQKSERSVAGLLLQKRKIPTVNDAFGKTGASVDEVWGGPALSEKELPRKYDPDPFGSVFNYAEYGEAYRLYQVEVAKHAGETIGASQSKRTTPSGSNERLKLCHGIATSLSALLKATDGSRDKTNQGSPSLYSMCLKKIPQFIAEEEYLTRIEDPDSDQDVMSDIYAHLESQAISSSWKPLRTIVRAHGVHHICVAIDQGTLSIGMALEMVQICLQENSRNEAVKIVSQMLATFLRKTQVTSELANSRDQGYLLAAFLKISSQVEGHGQTTRLLSEAITSHTSLVACAPLLAISEKYATYSISTRWDGQVAKAGEYLRVISQASMCNHLGEASLKIATMRRTSFLKSRRCSRRQRAADDDRKPSYCDWEVHRNPAVRHDIGTNGTSPVNVPNVTKHLFRDVFLRRGFLQDHPEYQSEELETLTEKLAQNARQILELGDSAPYSLQQRQSLAAVLWTNVLSRLSIRPGALGTASREISALVELDLSNADISLLGHCMSRVGDFCVNYTSENALGLLSKLLDSIVKLISSSSEPRCRSLLQKLAVSSAFAFCESSPKPSHLEWAVGIEEKIFGKDCFSPAQNPSPARNPLRTPAKLFGKPTVGYRWEAGICEWITRTPASAVVDPKKVVVTETNDNTIDELNDETLVEEWPVRLTAKPITQDSPSNAKQLVHSTRSKIQGAYEDTDIPDPVRVPIIDLDCSSPFTVVEESSFITDKVLKSFASALQDDDEIDELSENWCSQRSTQSSFQKPRSGAQTAHRQSSRIISCVKSSGHHLPSRAGGRSLISLFDGADGSSDMEDELGM